MNEYKNIFNVNIGVLGHVDSGKTSLVAALSTTLSTAALDKHPQSKERGITLDLGFSSFTLPAPPKIANAGYDGVQFTLVDCPGHASLIRTVVGGAQIMDLMILVVDVTKGIQTQTAECIIIGEITTDSMIVVLNKIDQLDPEKRERHIKKAKKLVASTLAATKFAGSHMVAVAARPATASLGCGIEDLKHVLLDAVQRREDTYIDNADVERKPKSASDVPPFLFFIDHCFAIRGQGTVLTGTVARGTLKVGDTLELPALKQQRKVKSMQVFRKPVHSCRQGDRVGICVTQLEAGVVERGVAASPGSIPTFSTAVISVDKVRFYPGQVKSMGKIHVIVGHQTVMAKMTFFGMPRKQKGRRSPHADASELNEPMVGLKVSANEERFDFNAEYVYQEELYGAEGRPAGAEGRIPAADSTFFPATTTAASALACDDVLPPHVGPQWAIAQFDEPVTAPEDALIIGARLDADLNASACRIALSGRIVVPFDASSASSSSFLQRLRVYKLKRREGVIERVEADKRTAICRGMFGKESELTRFVGMKIRGPGGQSGVLEGTFGKSGKFKVRFSEDLDAAVMGKGAAPPAPVLLEYKRFVFDPDKRRIAQ